MVDHSLNAWVTQIKYQVSQHKSLGNDSNVALMKMGLRELRHLGKVLVPNDKEGGYTIETVEAHQMVMRYILGDLIMRKCTYPQE